MLTDFLLQAVEAERVRTVDELLGRIGWGVLQLALGAQVLAFRNHNG